MALWSGKPKTQPINAEIIAGLSLCSTSAQVSGKLIEWFGSDRRFTTTTGIANIIAKHAPWVNYDLAKRLVAIDPALARALTDAPRVDKEFLKEQLDRDLGEIKLLRAENKDKLSSSNPEKTLPQLKARLRSVFANDSATDLQLGELVGCVVQDDLFSRADWVRAAQHPKADYEVWCHMAAASSGRPDIARALATQPKAMAYFPVVSAIRYHADEHPEFLLAFVRAMGVVPNSGTNDTIKKITREQWAFLVKNHTAEVLGVRAKVNQKFLSSLPKKALNAMAASPDKEMSEWGLRAVASVAAGQKGRAKAHESPGQGNKNDTEKTGANRPGRQTAL